MAASEVDLFRIAVTSEAETSMSGKAECLLAIGELSGVTLTLRQSKQSTKIKSLTSLDMYLAFVKKKKQVRNRGGVLKNLIRGGSAPRSHPLKKKLFIFHFWQEGYPFGKDNPFERITLSKGYPFGKDTPLERITLSKGYPFGKDTPLERIPLSYTFQS